MLVELKDALCRTEPLRMSGLILCLHLHGIDTKHAREDVLVEPSTFTA